MRDHFTLPYYPWGDKTIVRLGRILFPLFAQRFLNFQNYLSAGEAFYLSFKVQSTIRPRLIVKITRQLQFPQTKAIHGNFGSLLSM